MVQVAQALGLGTGLCVCVCVCVCHDTHLRVPSVLLTVGSNGMKSICKRTATNTHTHMSYIHHLNAAMLSRQCSRGNLHHKRCALRYIAHANSTAAARCL